MNRFFISTILENDDEIKLFLDSYYKKNRNFFINTLSEKFAGKFDINDKINYYTVKDIKLGWNNLEEKPDNPISYFTPYFLLLNLQHTKENDVIAYMYYKEIEELKHNLVTVLDKGIRDFNILVIKEANAIQYFDPRFIVLRNTIKTKTFLLKTISNHEKFLFNNLIAEDKDFYNAIQ